MKKVLITDNLHESCINIFEENSFSVDFKPGLSEDEIVEIINSYNVHIVRSATKVTGRIIDAGSNLELIGRAGTGVDNIDVDAASKKGIIVMNTPGGNTISAAELSISLIMALCRNIPQADKSMKEGRWDRKKYAGVELFGKKLGIIGLGKIGREVAKRALAFDMEILGYDPLLSKTLAGEMGIKLVGLNDIYKEADIISVHVPLTAETTNLISSDEIELCKEGVKIINCARGGIVDEQAVLDGIESGKISGAAFDVFNEEPPANRKLVDHPKVICTPHLGASTKDAQEKVARQIAHQIINYYKGSEYKGLVNADVISELNSEEIQPYLDLSEKTGLLISKIWGVTIEELSVELIGNLLHNHSNAVSSAVLKGLLSDRIDSPINFINAKYIAEDMGIKVNKVLKEKHDEYSSLISVSVNPASDNKKIAGTVLLDNDYRIVQIENFPVEFTPAGNLLFYTNEDKPGVLSKVSKILADNNLNIGGLSLGRINKGETALTVINLDQNFENRIAAEINKLEEIHQVFSVNL
jgi:D-3-phosphoglycerate dehydrogenase